MKFAIVALLGVAAAQVTDATCDEARPAGTDADGNALCKKYAAALAGVDGKKCENLVPADDLTKEGCATATVAAKKEEKKEEEKKVELAVAKEGERGVRKVDEDCN